MNFEQFYADRYPDFVRCFGIQQAEMMKGFLMDAFLNGKQYAFEEHANPLNNYNTLFRNRTQILTNQPIEERYANEIFGADPPYSSLNDALIQKYGYYDYPKWLKERLDETKLCKSCGVVMRDSEGKPTLVCSDNLDYCVNCEK